MGEREEGKEMGKGRGGVGKVEERVGKGEDEMRKGGRGWGEGSRRERSELQKRVMEKEEQRKGGRLRGRVD